jgi:tripartite motif-containing protein 71
MFWFMKRPTQETDAIAAYWDAQVEQHPAVPVPPAGLPASHGALIRQLHAEEAQGSLPAYQEELLQRLLATYQEDTSMTSMTTAASLPQPLISPPSRNGPRSSASVSRLRAVTPPQRTGWSLRPAVAIALAILLVLASVGGIWMLNSNQDEPHRLMAPVVATPSPDTSPGWTHFKGDAARRGESNFGPINQPVELWRYRAGDACYPAPAAVGDTVYVACNDGMLTSFDAVTGEVRWSFAAEPPIPFVDGTVVSGDLVYAIGGDNALYAVDINTVEERWRFDAAPIATTPAVDGGLAVIGTFDGFLIAIDAVTGEEQWRYQVTEGGAPRAAALLDGVAYVGSETGDFTAINATSGELLWAIDTGENPTGTAVVADGIAYIGSAADDQTGSLAAYDAATGELLWQQDDPMHSPSVSNGVGYSGSADGTVYAFDTATGEERWRIQVGGVARPLAVAGDILYVPSDGDRAVYAIDIATGEELWHVDVDGGIDSQASVVDGRIFVATTFGVVQAFGEGVAGEVAASPDASPAANSGATPSDSSSATPLATEEVTFELVWQTNGGPDPLLVPTGMALAPDGTIWVVDGANNRFQLFTPDGGYLETWGEAGDDDGQLSFLRSPGDPGNNAGDIAFAPDGSFYVTDSGNQRVQHFSADRTFVRAWGSFGMGDGQFISPFAVAVAPDGNVYVVDDVRDDVQVFDPDGTHLFTFSERGSEPGQLNYTGGLAIGSDGTVWVADFGNHRVQQFAADGTFIMTFGERGSEEGQFLSPAHIAVGEDRNLYVTDIDSRRVQMFTPEGEVLAIWSAADDREGALALPAGIAVDADGNVYVTDMACGTVQKFALMLPAAAGVTSEATPSAATDIAVELAWQSSGGPEPLLYPNNGLAVAPDGTVWVIDAGNNRFQLFSPEGEYLETWGEAGDGDGQLDFHRSPGDPGNSAGDIAFAPDGSFYVLDSANQRVQHFAADRSFVLAWGSFGPGDGQFIGPFGLAVAPDGNVYVVDDRRDDIQVFDPEGTHLFTFSEHGTEPGQLNSPGSLAIDVDGTVWVADWDNHRVQQFAADGTFLMTFGELGEVEGQFNLPTDIAIDQAGNVYVADLGNSRIQVFTPEGALLTAWSAADDGEGALSVPGGIAVDAHGGVYVTQIEAGTVQKFEATVP